MKIPQVHTLSKASQFSLLAVVILLGAVFFTVNGALQQGTTNTASHASTAGIVSGTVYRLTNKCSSLVMDVKNDSPNNSVGIVQEPWSGGSDKYQEYVIKDLGNGYYAIQPFASMKYLDVNGDSRVAGAQILQYLGTNSPFYDEQWTIVSLGSGYYKITGRNSGMAIGLSTCSTTQGLDIYQYSYDGSSRLQWKIESVASLPKPTVTPTLTPKPTATPTPTLTPKPTATPTPTPTPTPSSCLFHPTCTPGTFCPDIIINKCLTPTTTATPTLTLVPTVRPNATPTPTTAPAVSAIPTQTPAPQPTATPIPGHTELNLVLGLQGIGSGGDSANPTSEGNETPNRPTRTITVDVYDVQNQLVITQQGAATFDGSSGKFFGIVDLGTQVATGLYTVKVKTDQYLRSIVPGIQTITAGQATTLPTVTLVAGDINGDNAINIVDFNLLIGCYSDLLPATDCNATNNVLTDLNDDGAVNQFDYNLFLRELSNVGGQ